MLRKLIICFFLLSFNSAIGQNFVKNRNFYLSEFAYNPSSTGVDNKIVGQLSSEKTWIGAKGTPFTNSFYINSSLGRLGYGDPKDYISKSYNNIGAGVSMDADINGPLYTYSGRLSLAYHLQVNRRLKLSLGIAGIAQYFKVDTEILEPRDKEDVVIENLNKTTTLYNGHAGIRVQWGNFFGGLSVLDIADHALPQSNSSILPSYRTFCFSGGVQHSIFKEVEADLRAVVYNNRYGNMAYNSKLSFKIKNVLGIAIGYATPRSYLGYLTLSIKKIDYGYGFDYSASPLFDHAMGTHLLFIGFKL